MLDERYAKSTKSKSDIILRKVRKEGQPLTTPPPPNAPSWTVKDSY